MLVSEGLALRNVVHVNALLASITDFAAFNHIYATMFATAPPSRACVAVNLAPPCRLVLECYAYEDSSPQARFSLHVQGISYWAPANIGPYSQAIHVSLPRYKYQSQRDVFLRLTTFHSYLDKLALFLT